MTMDRRRFLNTAAMAALAPVFGGCDRTNVSAANSGELGKILTAGSYPQQLLEGTDKTPSQGYALDGQANPEPLILRAKQGQPFRVNFQNRLKSPTTIHWHGVRLPNGMDGVPYLTQDPVQPGETFLYEFTPPDAGSFWFHPHYDSLNQMGQGLAGIFIVDEAEDPGFDEDLTLVLKDYVLDKKTGQFGEITSRRGMSKAGTFGNVRTVNNQIRPTYRLPAGGWTRLRLINIDLTRVYKIVLEAEQALEAMIIAVDGNPIANPRPFGREHIGPGMRMDVAVRMPEKVGTKFLFRNTSSSKPWVMSEFVSVPSEGIAIGAEMPTLPLNPVPEPDLANAQVIKYRFDSGVGDGYAICGGVHEKIPTFWTINNIPWPEYAVVPPPLDVLEKGKSYVFELSNHTPHPHPIHIHGMTFKVLSSNRREIDPYHTDTVLLRADERVRAAFVADNPGDWMFHCHIIEHQASGMMGHIQVV